MRENTIFFDAFFHQFSTIFDLNIHGFLDQISTRLAMKSKCVKVNKTLRGRTNFEGRLFKNNTKIDAKSIKNEGAKKQPKKLAKNRFWDACWPPKPFQNRRKIDEKTMFKKEGEKKQKKNDFRNLS